MICDAPSIMRPMTYTQPRVKSKTARSRRPQQIDDLFDLLKYRTVMSLNGHARNSVSLVFTSYAKGEGVSTMAVNFAAALSSEQKHKVLLIDMNLEKPSLHKIFAKDKNGDQAESGNDGMSGSGPRRETIKVNPYLDVLVSHDKEPRAATDGMKMEKFSSFVEKSKEQFAPYQQAWSQLAKKRSFRCNLCPDGLGRLADLSCGDAWDKYQGNGDPGRSIVVVCSERGRRILHGAMEAGYVTLKPIGAQQVQAAQVNFLERRKNLFGRLLGMKLLGVPTPRFTGFDLWRDWSRLPLSEKARSILGTMRRLIRKGLWHRQRCVAREPAGG